MKITRVLAAVCLATVVTSCNDFDPVEYMKKDPSEILQRFSKAAVKSDDAMVILDNEIAFQKKLDVIRSAKKELRLAYYIFSSDESSSVIANELIKVATRANNPVKVKLLVDLHYQYKNIDFFSMLVAKGKGNIDVRFYGRPGRDVMKDVFYLTSTCESTKNKTRCDDKKRLRISKFFDRHDSKADKKAKVSKLNNGYSGLFLAGLYSKDSDFMAAAVTKGQQIDIKALQSSDGSMSEEDKKGLQEFGKILFKSKFSGSGFDRLANKLKLKFALIKYADSLSPVYGALVNHLPIGGNRKQAKKEWTHLTDFVHHKLLLADEAVVQLGGRNLENSYHMRPNQLVEKYLFMDTDVFATVKKDGDKIAQSFDDLFGYRSLVATIDEIEAFAPSSIVMNKRIAKKACAHIDQKQDDAGYSKCIDKQPTLELDERIERQYKQMVANVATYESSYRPQENASIVEDHISEAGAGGYFKVSPSATLYYVENVPYRIEKKGECEGKPGERIYGSEINNDTIDSKGIHGVWTYEFLRACLVSEKENRKVDIVVNNAYMFPPAEMLYTFGRMIDGTTDCSKVTVNLITNSADTTDLGPVNLLAQMAFKAFFTAISNPEVQEFNKDKYAQFKLFEYSAQTPASGGRPASLHTKAIAFDSGLYIGSANMDTRSIVLDTNNGFFIKDDAKLISDYKGHIQKAIKSGLIYEVADNYVMSNRYQQVTSDQIIALGWQKVFEDFLVDRDFVDDERAADIQRAFVSIMKKVEKNTELILYGAEVTEGHHHEDQEVIGVTADRDAMKTFNMLTKEL